MHNETEKMIKYTELKTELERIWNVHFQLVPVVIGCLGAVSRGIVRFVTLLGLHRSEVGIIQEIAILASSHILRRYVTQSGIPADGE
jgi:hypothetical protein